MDQLNFLLFTAGKQIAQLYQRLKAPEHEETFEQITEKISKHFNPSTNTTRNIFNFRAMMQFADESFDAFYSRLQEKIVFCGLPNPDFELKHQIIQGCASKQLRGYALSNPEQTLAQLVQKGLTYENVSSQVDHIYGGTEAINKVKALPPGYQSRRQAVSNYQAKDHGRETAHKVHFQQPNQVQPCYRCGGEFPHQRGCPARDQACNKCGKIGHFIKVCRQKDSTQPWRQSGEIYQERQHFQQHRFNQQDPRPTSSVQYLVDQVPEEDYYDVNDDYENIYALGRSSKIPQTTLQIGDTVISFHIDTGAECNILDEQSFSLLRPQPRLYPCTTVLKTYGPLNSRLPTCGEFTTEVIGKNHSVQARFVVAKGKCGNLLSYESSVELGVVNRINVVGCEDSYKASMMAKFPRLFENRIGLIKDVQIKLSIDPKVRPVYQPLRPQPYHLVQPIQRCLERMEAHGLITRQFGPTPWLSNIHPVPKPGSPDEVRLTIDMRAANTAILRERHPMRRINDLIIKINGATHMSKLDLNCAYHQFALTEDSKQITGFITPTGAYVWNRLSFGISSAAELFQRATEDLLAGLNGCLNMSDDIFVWGASEESHDENLERVLERLESRGATLNGPKCRMKVRELVFFGVKFTPEGISVTDDKREAFVNAKEPQNALETVSFLGMAAFLDPHIINLAIVAEPLRRLTRAKAKWNWTDEQQKAFELLKASLIKQPLAFFDLHKRTKVTVDAGPKGIAYCVTQHPYSNPDLEQLVSNGSRMLTEVEQRYCQMEREAVGVVWAFEKNHLILIGCEFDLYTDNAAVQAVLDNPYSTPTARIRRLALRLLPYKFRVHHIKGAGNIADYQSRNPVESSCCEHERLAEEYIYMLTTACIPNALTRSELIAATAKDVTLLEVMSAVESRILDKQSPFFQALKDNELVRTSDGLLVRGDRVVIPVSLQQRMIDIGHTGHQGVTKTKALLKRHVWFPHIDSMVESAVRACHKCQVNTNKTSRNPLAIEPMPEGPWEMVDADFFGPLPTGNYKFVLIDRFSRFLIVRSITNLRASTVISTLDQILSEYGIMERFKSDNGSPFQSREFKAYCLKKGINHQRITPLYPAANGLAERAMKPLGESIRVIGKPSLDYEEEIREHVSAYNSTPHSTTGLTPRELFFKSKTSSVHLPVFHQKAIRDDLQSRAVENDARAKQKSKENTDFDRNSKPHTFQIGDLVLLKQVKRNKTTTPFDPDPYHITGINHSMITVSRAGKSYARNSSLIQHFTRRDATNTLQTASIEPSRTIHSNQVPAIAVLHFSLPAAATPVSQTLPRPQDQPRLPVIPLPWHVTPTIALPWHVTPAIAMPWHVERVLDQPLNEEEHHPENHQEETIQFDSEEVDTNESFESMTDTTPINLLTHVRCIRCNQPFRIGAGIANHMRRNTACEQI